MRARAAASGWTSDRRRGALALALTLALALALAGAACDGGGGGEAGTEADEATCRDGLDNDGDGRKDCLDPQCQVFPFCAPGYDAGGSDAGGLVRPDTVRPDGGAGADGAAEDVAGGPDVGCRPLCEGRECGDDGCGGTCGSCPIGQACLAYQCEDCEPTCSGNECGDDGCGGSCGTCLPGRACQNGICVLCTRDCAGKECGPDGCGGECGVCNAPEFCYEDECVDCVPNCAGKECGSDDCGGWCANCPGSELCDEHTFQCYEQCLPNCAGRACGGDGCGGSCGTCDAGLVCNTANGACQETCRPYCTNRECGTDGCGGSCGGPCTFPESCHEQTGRCVDECQRQCAGKECGDDGCGSRCGYCPAGQGCNAQGLCYDLPYNCPKILQCARVCADDDAACVTACRETGQSSSRIVWDGLKACMDLNCPGTPDHNLNACLAQSCGTQYQNCNLDLLCGDPGTESCATVSSCMGSCADGVCLNACLCRASQPAYPAALEYARCLLQSCPGFDGACMGGGMMGACAMQWVSCFSGGL